MLYLYILRYYKSNSFFKSPRSIAAQRFSGIVVLKILMVRAVENQNKYVTNISHLMITCTQHNENLYSTS